MESSPAAIRPSAWVRPVAAGILLLGIASDIAAALGLAIPWWCDAMLDLAIVALVIAGVVWQGSGIFARPILAIRTNRAELALTFDDGPDPRFTPALLDLLDAHGHRATFFVIGERVAAHPELVREIVRRGHTLGNHSYQHSFVTNLKTPRRLAVEVRRLSELLSQLTGAAPRWFRARVGLLSPRVAAAVKRADMELVAWTASARDGVASCQVDDAVRRLELHLVPGAILVLHDGVRGNRQGSIALPVLQQVLQRMEAKGLRSVTLDQLLAPERPPLDAAADAAQSTS